MLQNTTIKFQTNFNKHITCKFTSGHILLWYLFVISRTYYHNDTIKNRREFTPAVFFAHRRYTIAALRRAACWWTPIVRVVERIFSTQLPRRTTQNLLLSKTGGKPQNEKKTIHLYLGIQMGLSFCHCITDYQCFTGYACAYASQ